VRSAKVGVAGVRRRIVGVVDALSLIERRELIGGESNLDVFIRPVLARSSR
jgi:hypothetical protein